MRTANILYLTLTPLLYSCATPYVPPAPGKETATVEFRLFSNAHNALVYKFDSRECSNPQKVTELVRSPDRPLAYKYETTIQAGQEVIATIRTSERSGAYVTTCQPTVAFTPLAGHAYTVELDRNYGECSARVTEWNSKTSKNEPPPTLSNFPPKCKVPG